MVVQGIVFEELSVTIGFIWGFDYLQPQHILFGIVAQYGEENHSIHVGKFRERLGRDISTIIKR